MTTDDAQHDHVTLELAADFDERLLDAAASAEVAARIASCATCAAALDSIAKTRAALTALPAIPMPSAVADRLHAALAAETRSAQVPGGAATVTSMAAGSVRSRMRRLWIPLGAGIAATGALTFVLQTSSKSSTTAAQPAAAATSAAGSAAPPSFHTLASGTDYAHAQGSDLRNRLSVQLTAGTTVTATGALPESKDAFGSAPVGTAAASPADAATTAAAGTPTASTSSAPGPVSAATPLPSATSAASATASAAAGSRSAVDSGATTFSYSDRPLSAISLVAYGALQDPAVLAACVQRLQDPDAPVEPRLVDFASYAGKPAVAVYFPSNGAGQLDVYIVGTACGPSGDDLLKFLRIPAAP